MRYSFFKTCNNVSMDSLDKSFCKIIKDLLLHFRLSPRNAKFLAMLTILAADWGGGVPRTGKLWKFLQAELSLLHLKLLKIWVSAADMKSFVRLPIVVDWVTLRRERPPCLINKQWSVTTSSESLSPCNRIITKVHRQRLGLTTDHYTYSGQAW